MKTLTVSVAAYNVEAYLKETLESLIVPDIMGDLEVIIENDGSSDATASIAASFVERFPGTFRLINKENGGYGSTVSRSVREASGKYFKLLDGDDWFQTESLADFIRELKDIDADWILTDMVQVREGTNEEVPSPSNWASFAGSTVPIEQLPVSLIPGMWQLTVRTSLLKEHLGELPHHVAYTDQLFVMRSMRYVRTAAFISRVIYRYRVGVEGQTVSPEGRIKNHQAALSAIREILKEYGDVDDELQKNFMRERVMRYYIYAVRTMLLLPRTGAARATMTGLILYAKKYAPDIARSAEAFSGKIRLLHTLPAIGYLIYGGREKNWA